MAATDSAAADSAAQRTNHRVESQSLYYFVNDRSFGVYMGCFWKS